MMIKGKVVALFLRILNSHVVLRSKSLHALRHTFRFLNSRPFLDQISRTFTCHCPVSLNRYGLIALPCESSLEPVAPFEPADDLKEAIESYFYVPARRYASMSTVQPNVWLTRCTDMASFDRSNCQTDCIIPSHGLREHYDSRAELSFAGEV